MDANYYIVCAFLLEHQEQTHYETLNYFDFLGLLGSMTLALAIPSFSLLPISSLTFQSLFNELQ